MGLVSDAFSVAFRDFVTSGIPASGPHEPVKSEVRGIGTTIEQLLALAGIAGSIYPDTSAGLAATTDGKLFLVQGAGDNFALLYKNVGGSAVDQNISLPSARRFDSYARSGTFADRDAIPLDQRERGLRFLVTENDNGTFQEWREYEWRLAGDRDGQTRTGALLTAPQWCALWTEREKLHFDIVPFQGTLPAANVEQMPNALANIGELYQPRIYGFRATALSTTSPLRAMLEWDGEADGFTLSWGDFTLPVGGGIRAIDTQAFDYDAVRPLLFTGDSMLDGTWAASAAAELSRDAVVVAKYSSGAKQVYRLGVRKLLCTAAGNTIPASGGSVAVTSINGVAPSASAVGGNPSSFDLFAAHGFLNTASGDMISTHCSEAGTWGGRHGVMSVPNGGTPSYTFTPDDGLGASTVPAQSPFVPDNLARLKTHEVTARLSQNYAFAGPGNPVFPNDINPRVLEDLQLIAAETVGQPFTALGLSPQNNFITGTPFYTALRYLNGTQANGYTDGQFYQLFGSRYAIVTVAGVKYNNSDYVRWFGRDGSANDQADYDAGINPRSVMETTNPGEVHYNAKGEGLEKAFWLLWRQQRKRPPAITLATLFTLVGTRTQPAIFPEEPVVRTSEPVTAGVTTGKLLSADLIQETDGAKVLTELERLNGTKTLTAASSWSTKAPINSEDGVYYKASDGSKVTSPSWVAKTYGCAGSDWYALTVTGSNALTALLSFFDGAGAFISAVAAPVNATKYRQMLFQTPVNARSFIVSGIKSGSHGEVPEHFVEEPTLMPQGGRDLAQIKADRDNLRVWVDLVLSGDLTWAASTFYQVANGASSTNASYIGAKIRTNPGEQFRVTAWKNASTSAAVIWLDSVGNVLSVVEQGANVVAAVTTTATAPDGAAWACFTSRTDRLAESKIERLQIETGGLAGLKDKVASNAAVLTANGSAIATNSADLDSLKDFVPISLGAANIGYYYRNNDAVQAGPSGTNYRNYTQLAVTAGETLRFSGTISGTATAIGVYVDGAGAKIGSAFGVGTASPVVWPETTITVPAGAVGLRVTGYGVDPVVKRKGLAATPAVIAALQDDSGKTARLAASSDRANGKRLLGIGTSIPAGAPQNGTSYWAQAAAALGLTVDNRAVASSCIRAGLASAANGAVVIGSISGTVLTITKVLYGTVAVGQAISAAIVAGGTTTIASNGTGTGGTGTYNLSSSGGTVASTTIFIGPDPLGWTGQDYSRVQRALGHTLGEKAELIANWSKWRPLLTGSPPATLNSTDITNINGWSYENRVLPFLATNDQLLISHGYNDSAVSGHTGEINTVPANSRDRCTFIGMFNWLVDQIQASRDASGLAPIPVIIEAHYSRNHRPGIVEAQEYLANLWDMPAIPTWKHTGWTNQTLTTTGYWTATTNGTWVTSGGAPQTIAYRDRALPDSLHPHSDASGKATATMANAVTAYLRDYVRAV